MEWKWQGAVMDTSEGKGGEATACRLWGQVDVGVLRPRPWALRRCRARLESCAGEFGCYSMHHGKPWEGLVVFKRPSWLVGQGAQRRSVRRLWGWC